MYPAPNAPISIRFYCFIIQTRTVKGINSLQPCLSLRIGMGCGIQSQIATFAVAAERQRPGHFFCSPFQIIKRSELCRHRCFVAQHKVFFPANKRGIRPSEPNHHPYARYFKRRRRELDAALFIHIIDLIQHPNALKPPAACHFFQQ